MNRHDPLKMFIENGVLVMQIGVECLAKAVELDPDLCEPDNDGGEWIAPEISDPDKFAEGILTALKYEDDGGTTLIHAALDTAALNAIESGAEGIKMPDDIMRERKSSEQKPVE